MSEDSVFREDNSGKLLDELCAQLNVPKPNGGFSFQLMKDLVSALKPLRTPENVTPLELVQYLLNILSTDVVCGPLDHLDAQELLDGEAEAVQVY